MKSPVTDGECKRIHAVGLTSPHFIRPAELFSHMFMAQGHCVSLEIVLIFHLTGMSLLFPQQSTPSHTPCTSLTTLMPTIHSEDTCAPLQVQNIESVADMDAPPGYEPNPFTEMSTMDFSQYFFHGLSMTSIYGFAESFATPPLDLEINDEQPTELLASPLFPQEREASADRSQVYHSRREKTWCPTRPDFKPVRRDPSR